MRVPLAASSVLALSGCAGQASVQSVQNRHAPVSSARVPGPAAIAPVGHASRQAVHVPQATSVPSPPSSAIVIVANQAANGPAGTVSDDALTATRIGRRRTA